MFFVFGCVHKQSELCLLPRSYNTPSGPQEVRSHHVITTIPSWVAADVLRQNSVSRSAFFGLLLMVLSMMVLCVCVHTHVFPTNFTIYINTNDK